jgi:hypothetical protein
MHRNVNSVGIIGNNLESLPVDWFILSYQPNKAFRWRMKIQVFLDVTSCRRLTTYRRFGNPYTFI